VLDATVETSGTHAEEDLSGTSKTRATRKAISRVGE
jgi:hypothetical protein